MESGMSHGKKSDPRIISLFPGGSTFVDLGCGSGHFLDEMVDRYDLCVGLDFSDVRMSLREGYPSVWKYRKADLNEKFPLEDDTVDDLLANQVIEHISDPRYFSSEIYRVLKPGGNAVITTPNIRYIKHLYRLIVKGEGPQTAGGNTLDGDWDDGHIHYFTHGDLRQIFISQGFSSVKSKALIDVANKGLLRSWLDQYSHKKFVYEFLSGNIFIHLTK